MDLSTKNRLLVGILTILSGVLALACMIVGTLAVEMNFDAFSDPVLTLQYAANHRLAYWFNILDMFGYYLLLLPVIFHLHHRFKDHSPWMPLFTFMGAVYVLVGAMGAAMLAAVWPALMQEYLTASDAARPAVELVFKTFTLAVTTGLWNTLEVLFAAVWWIGMGFLIQARVQWLGLLTIATGVSALLDGAGNILGLPMLAEAGLNLYLMLAIVWAVATGVWWIKDKTSYENAQVDERAATVHFPKKFASLP